MPKNREEPPTSSYFPSSAPNKDRGTPGGNTSITRTDRPATSEHHGHRAVITDISGTPSGSTKVPGYVPGSTLPNIGSIAEVKT